MHETVCGIGANYALYDKANKAVYNLDDQAKVVAFAGRSVRVTGTVDGNKIKITDVKTVS